MVLVERGSGLPLFGGCLLELVIVSICSVCFSAHEEILLDHCQFQEPNLCLLLLYLPIQLIKPFVLNASSRNLNGTSCPIIRCQELPFRLRLQLLLIRLLFGPVLISLLYQSFHLSRGLFNEKLFELLGLGIVLDLEVIGAPADVKERVPGHVDGEEHDDDEREVGPVNGPLVGASSVVGLQF